MLIIAAIFFSFFYMTAQLLDGKSIANDLKKAIKETLNKQALDSHRVPCMAAVLVGDDPASRIYVNNKRKACEEVGILSEAFYLKTDSTTQELLELIQALNTNTAIDGILVQLPLPAHIDTYQIIEAIAPQKDIDGFHPYNLGRLAQKKPFLRPCTPYGIIQLLNAYRLPLKGKHAVVVGASNIVGRPMALEFLLAGATTTICHRFTHNLQQCIEIADIVVVATGICDIVSPKWLKKEHILVDVGIHRLANNTLRGDIDFSQAKEQVAWISPVPGGVGPMTIATLLQNTLQAAKISLT